LLKVKTREIEKLQKLLRDKDNEVKDLQNEIRHSHGDNSQKDKFISDKENGFIQDLFRKEKEFCELGKQLEIEELAHNETRNQIKELELTVKNKEDIIDELKKYNTV